MNGLPAAGGAAHGFRDRAWWMPSLKSIVKTARNEWRTTQALYGRSIKLSGRHRCSLDTWNARCGRRLVVESFCIWWFGWNGNMDCGYWISKWIQAVSDEFIDEAYTSYLGGFTKRCIGITSVLIFRCIFILWCLIYDSMHYDFFVNTFIYSML